MPHSAANVRERRFGKTFDAIDTDRDGITNLADWEEFAYYLCDQFGEPVGSPTATRVKAAVLGWWYTILGQLDRCDDRRLTKAQFSLFYANASKDRLDVIICQYVDAVFALCDSDADNCLSRREFAGVLRAHGVPEHQLTQTMQRMVAGPHDCVSKQRYTELMVDFCYSTDSRSPGCRLYGTV
jgi:hypothetical protein